MKKRLYELAIVKTPRVLEAHDEGWSTISTPLLASHAIRAIIGKGVITEYFVVLHLDSRNKMIGYERYGGGCSSAVRVDASTIFRTVLLSGARSILIGHNHPSGSVLPSDDDYAITENLKRVSTMLSIDFVDHIVITDDDFHSINVEDK